MDDRNIFYGLDPGYSRGMGRGVGDLGSLVDPISVILDSITLQGAGAERFLGDWDGEVARPQHDAVAPACDLHQVGVAEGGDRGGDAAGGAGRGGGDGGARRRFDAHGQREVVPRGGGPDVAVHHGSLVLALD